MLERERLDSKKISKTNAVTSVMGTELPEDDVHVGPSDYVPWLTDRKWAHIRLEGKSFGDVPLTVELKLEVWDSPNSAGVVIDAVRLIKLALNNGIAGQLDGPSSYLMKSPHNQRPDADARADDRGVHRASTRRKAPGQRADELEASRGEPARSSRAAGYHHEARPPTACSAIRPGGPAAYPPPCPEVARDRARHPAAVGGARMRSTSSSAVSRASRPSAATAC